MFSLVKVSIFFPLYITSADFFSSLIFTEVIAGRRQTTEGRVALCLIASAMSMHPITLLQARA